MAALGISIKVDIAVGDIYLVELLIGGKIRENDGRGRENGEKEEGIISSGHMFEANS